MKILNVSHAHCTDGLISAYIARYRLRHAGRVDHLFLNYTDDFEIALRGADVFDYECVFITDFSFKLERDGKQSSEVVFVNELMSKGVFVVIIDHHDSSAGLKEVNRWISDGNLGMVSVMHNDRVSGAVLTNEYLKNFEFFKTKGAIVGDLIFSLNPEHYSQVEQSNLRTWLAEITSDYDLALKEIPESKYLNAYIQYLLKQHGHSTEVFGEIDKFFNSALYSGNPKLEIYNKLNELPKAIYETQHSITKAVYERPSVVLEDVREVIDDEGGMGSLFPVNLLPETDNYKVYIFNAHPQFTTEGSFLHEDDTMMVITWSKVGRLIKFSIRSKKEKGLDFSALAEYYGGGGHPTACSFSIDPNSKNPEHQLLIDLALGKLQ